MATTTDTPTSIDDYKLITTFHNNLTIHSREKQEQLWVRIKLIGTGAFGDVWLEQKVAHPLAAAGEDPEEVELAADVELRAVKRIRYTGQNRNWPTELKILAQLKNNPSFVDFIGWYDDRSNYVYFAMEYMRHGDLSQYLKRVGSEVKSQAKAIVTQILTGLIALHEQNICHRDIKSKNILVASTSPIQVKIADFGLSKNESGSSLRTACGTTHYTAPELQGFVRPSKNRRSYTNLVDIWSLGIVAHEVLTCELPFLQSSPEDDDDSDSDSESESGIEIDSQFEQPEYPEMDMALFANYCSGNAAFPRGPLKAAGISSLGITFVEAVLVANPRSRMSAEQALAHPWLLDPTPEPYSADGTAPLVEEVSTPESGGEGSGRVEKDEGGGLGAGMDVVLHRGSSLFRRQYAARERFNRFGVNRSGVMQQRYARERRYIDT